MSVLPQAMCETCGGVELPCDCEVMLGAFVNAMRRELIANKDKGGMPMYRLYGIDGSLSEVFDHAAKLHCVAREIQRRRNGREPRPMPWGSTDEELQDRAREFAADVGNCALGVLLNLGLYP